MVKNSLVSQHWMIQFPHKFGSEWTNERKNERSGARKRSEQCGASDWVSDASKRSKERKAYYSINLFLNHSIYCAKEERNRIRKKRQSKMEKIWISYFLTFPIIPVNRKWGSPSIPNNPDGENPLSPFLLGSNPRTLCFCALLSA